MGKPTQSGDAPTVLADLVYAESPPAGPDSAKTSQDPAKVGTDSDNQEISTPRDNLATAPPQDGRRIGKYVILAEQGAGGMGVVFQALDPDLQRVVALKMIRSGAMARPKEIRRFLQESAALARIKHPNIVLVHDSGHFEGQPYFVMEFLSGGSLNKNLARYKEDARRAVALIAKLARAVHQLHQHNMVHRDLKPANVLLDADGEPYISDFGLVKLLDTSDNLTHSNQGLGTPGYMAPEQTGLIKTRPGPQTDIWALGIMLHELLSGSRPFAAEDRAELFRQIIHDDPPRPSALKTDFDPGLEAVLLKCLEKNPAHRFPTAAELADELDRWLAGEPLKTKPERGWRRVRRFARKHPAILTLAAVLCFFAIVTPVFLYLRDPERVAEAYYQKLVRGETVILVPEKGMPRYARPWYHDTGSELLGRDGHYQIVATEHYFVNLLDGLPKGAFRFSAKIRHDTSDLGGRIGLFVAQYKIVLPEATSHSLVQLSFNNLIDFDMLRKQSPLYNPKTSPQGNPAFFGSRSFVRRPAESPLDAPLGPGELFNLHKGGCLPWRQVALEVGGDGVNAIFDDLPPRFLSWKKAEEQLANHFRVGTVPNRPENVGLFQQIPSAVNPQGALGLFVQQGSASFTEVKVEPLASNQ